MSERDPFDLDGLAVPRELVEAQLKPAAKQKPAKRSKRAETGFVKLPLAWIRRLQLPKNRGTYPLAEFLHYQNWRRPGEPITVSNVALEGFGLSMSRWQKYRALEELGSLGLIYIDRVGQHSPIVQLSL